ncbi:3-isopropylmalate dehydratase small subunit [Alteribacillus iranensis]|uniref:3-isopropylmalate dehydratase small subunit n=1 Tax=Alteribacillus iranensis TaxID=930128 RepID=A0A1I2BEZ8_9BACI|nr:3-isopropylmalate dehydratase small subunit [Alteribacillus iranensis]SFE54686.1 3-isopropylmalate/(R)-2-methylmalate dehydratase small subunit [Alteribacillus iranensis]
MKLTGNAHVYGSNIDTDRIIPGKYTKTLDMSQLADHVLEDLDPDFRKNVKEGDVIVADDNFGCGSSREQAPLALKAAGISAVVARSYARIFFRNAINVGLPVIEASDHAIEKENIVQVDLMNGIIFNKTKNETYQGTTMPRVMINILEEGGLVPYLKKHKDYVL